MSPSGLRFVPARDSGRVRPVQPAPVEPGAGRVSLVGAGPGDPELITIKGLRRVREADAILYDRLAPVELLREAPSHAETIYCGKSPGAPAMTQEEIHELAIDLARSGHRVVRLKGGDPYVLGRGGEEGLALAAAGVAWEVVPGVTSAVSVPAVAGIPLTHRGVASSFAVVTGHGREDRAGRPALPVADTLVILMGVSNLLPIRRELLRRGSAPDTPAAIVERGTLPGQRILVGTLGTLDEVAARGAVRPPAILVIGEVVRLQGDLRPRESDRDLTKTFTKHDERR